MGGTDDIVFEVAGALGRVILNRPKALNALTLDMVRRLDARLIEWAADDGIAAVVIEGAGERAFCAGGDIRALYQAMRDGSDLTAEFYRAEYTNNHRVFTFPKPYIALIDGVVMGGGVGVSVHGSHRVVTENVLFAMPETGIGLFPDVGGTFFLSRMPGELGMYLGLTGARLGAADALYCGIGTHFAPRARLAEITRALAAIDPEEGARRATDEVLAGFAAADAGAPPLADHRAAIDRCFAGDSVEEVVGALAAEGGEWAAKTLAVLESKSPTSLKVTFRQLREGRDLDFAEAMRTEYRLSQRFCAGHDFPEGVRAAVIDKDNAPRWRPDRLADVSETDVDAYFAPLPGGDLVL